MTKENVCRTFFCLLGVFSKSYAYRFLIVSRRPETIEQLKEAIRQEGRHSARDDPQSHGQLP